ncbi:unnamed protein product [Mytilus coruscus]|uniref:RRM domain-containing protein n=1 Tax=Mytilus coruscus TaxID=42192 RepID=A0A6J8CX22_MYTCO|nr:unnamed protein product [Mytilus coruscus]
MATSMSYSRSSTTSTKHTNAGSCGEINGHKLLSHVDQNGSEFAAKQFYSNKQITLKNVNTVLTELAGTLTENGVKILEFDEQNKQAKVQFIDFDNVLDVMEYLSRSFDVSVESSNKLLCLAHLPSSYTDQQLRELVSSHGNLCRCFMYRCRHSGGSLGYGFVEFDCSIEKSKQIELELDWKEVDSHSIHCETVDINSYDKLCSKCLLIDNLPKDFTDVMALRDIFSCCHKPLYCQIVMKDNESLGYGIIEYKTYQEAQRSKNKLDNHEVQGQPIRLTYCIPGKPGIFLCSKIVSKFGSCDRTEPPKKGLLPDPIFMKDDLLKTPLVRQLCNQQPNLISCFKQALTQLQQTYLNQVTSSAKPGLLGPAPSVQLNPLINPSMQLGLIVLLALQLQSKSQNKILSPLDLFGLVLNQHTKQDGQSSILGDPLAIQASVVLKNLTSQISTVQPLTSNPPVNQNLQQNYEHNSSLLQSLALNLKNVNMNMLINLGQLASSIQTSSGLLGSGPPQPLMNDQSIVKNVKVTEQKAKPKSLLEIDMSNYQHNMYPVQDKMKSSVKENIPYNRGPALQQEGVYSATPTINSNMQFNRQNSDMHLDQYGNFTAQNGSRHYPAAYDQINKVASLSNVNQGSSHSSQYVDNVTKIKPLMTDMSRSHLYHENMSQNRIAQVYNGNSKQGHDEPDGLMPPPAYTNPQPPQTETTSTYQNRSSRTYSDMIDQYMTNQPNAPQSLLSRTSYHDDLLMSDTYTDPSSLYEQSYRSNDSMYSDGGYSTSGYCTPIGVKDDGLLKTPVGQKRSYSHLLPPPEASPEGDFIGQHSQGIGGHYAESYRKRPRLDREDLKLRY